LTDFSPRTWFRRFLATALGAVAALLVLEGVLAGFALVLTPQSRSADSAERAAPTNNTADSPADELRILCLGDSNTFGIHLDAQQSYPAQLGALLANAPGGRWRVVNLGYPGRNSAELRYYLDQQLERYQPSIAIVWTGTNTSWSRAMAHLWELSDREAPPPPLAAFERLRTVRMLRVMLDRPARQESAGGALLDGGDGDRLAFEERGAPRAAWLGAPDDAEMARRIRLDLTRVHTLCEARGVKLLLLDYPYDVRHLREVVNPAIEAVAAATGTARLSLAAALKPRLATLGRDALVFADHHLMAAANGEVARLIAARLVEQGWVAEGPWRDVPPLEHRFARLAARCERTAAPDGLGASVRIHLEGTPGGRARATLEPLFLRADNEFADPVRGPRREVIEAYVGAPLVRDLGFLPLDGRRTRTLELPPPLAIGPPAFPRGAVFFGWRIDLGIEVEGGGAARARALFVDGIGRPLATPTRAAWASAAAQAASEG